MNARAHLIISGYVQGVFFRSFVRSEIRLLNITGWVRNLPSGQVEAVFEGEKDDVKEMPQGPARLESGRRPSEVAKP